MKKITTFIWTEAMIFLPVCAGTGGITKPAGGGPVGGAVGGALIPWKSVAVYGGGGSIFLLFSIWIFWMFCHNN